jgi:hypothetical protein
MRALGEAGCSGLRRAFARRGGVRTSRRRATPRQISLGTPATSPTAQWMPVGNRPRSRPRPAAHSAPSARAAHALHTAALDTPHPRRARRAWACRTSNRATSSRGPVPHSARRGHDPGGWRTRGATAAAHHPGAGGRPVARSHPRGQRHRDRVRQSRPRTRRRLRPALVAARDCPPIHRRPWPQRDAPADRRRAALYLQAAPDESLILHQRFIELDRGTIPPEQLAAKLARYAQLNHYSVANNTPRDRCGAPTTARFPRCSSCSPTKHRQRHEGASRRRSRCTAPTPHKAATGPYPPPSPRSPS